MILPPTPLGQPLSSSWPAWAFAICTMCCCCKTQSGCGLLRTTLNARAFWVPEAYASGATAWFWFRSNPFRRSGFLYTMSGLPYPISRPTYLPKKCQVYNLSSGTPLPPHRCIISPTPHENHTTHQHATKMTASAVFILDVKGKVIISRNYRGDVPMNCVERFSGHVLEADEADERPVWLEHGTTYVYIKYNNLYIMAVTTRNSNAAMILLFLYRLVEVRSSTILTWKHQR